MTVEDVKERIARIKALATIDDEAAHGAEDKLYEDVLRAVAAMHPDAYDLAHEALKSQEVDFCRWCG